MGFRGFRVLGFRDLCSSLSGHTGACFEHLGSASARFGKIHIKSPGFNNGRPGRILRAYALVSLVARLWPHTASPGPASSLWAGLAIVECSVHTLSPKPRSLNPQGCLTVLRYSTLTVLRYTMLHHTCYSALHCTTLHYSLTTHYTAPYYTTLHLK